MYPLLSLRSLPTLLECSPLSPLSAPHSQCIWTVFNTVMIFSPYSISVSAEQFPLAKHFYRNLITLRLCVIDFIAMFLPSSDKWSITLHWLSVATCTWSLLWGHCCLKVKGFATGCHICRFYPVKPHVIFVAIALDLINYLKGISALWLSRIYSCFHIFAMQIWFDYDHRVSGHVWKIGI